MSFIGIDLYSDTSTRPSVGMKKAMMEAELGDEQRGEDPTTKKLEEVMALKLKKSAAMFFPTATMCNQIAAKLYTRPGDEVLGAKGCHMFDLEGGALAFHSSVQPYAVNAKNGIFNGDDLKKAFRFSDDPNSPRQSLVLVENTTNKGGGYAWQKEQLDSVTVFARSHGLKCHLDGSRLFNAAISVNESIESLSEGFDSVTLCFSKGLGCGAGAILAFDAKDLKEVRRLKQMFGGALRQSGMLTAACLYALEHHVPDLKHDHRRARILAEGLASIPGLKVENESPDSNIVYFSLNTAKYDPESFLLACLKRKLRFSCFGVNRFRAVTHRDIDDEGIKEAVLILKELLS